MSNSTNIAKNTIYLYLRMVFVMVVTLYTSRIVLHALGEEDYGIQNVVGGIVLVLSFLATSISGAISRYYAFEIGRANVKELNSYFVHSLYAFGFLVLIILGIGETVGLWFIKNKMTISLDRMDAAIWVYQFSLISFLIQMLIIPFNSMIIAQEKMNIYAYVSILECILKLQISYLITDSDYDRLKLYSSLLFVATLLSQGFYGIYCKIKFRAETRLSLFWNKTKFKELVSFSGWILLGTLSDICKGQGLNIIINMFFNPVINAARAISFQISNAMNQFVSGFFTACRPQITKYYAKGDTDRMINLVFLSSRLCNFLFLILSLPVYMKVPFILRLWLGAYPSYTPIFTKLIIVITFIESMNYPLTEALIATGKIKTYQIITGGLIILNLPISYHFLKLGYPPETTMYISLIIAVLAQISRVCFMKIYHHMSLCSYINDVVFRVIFVSTLSYTLTFLLSLIFCRNEVLYLFLFCTCSTLCTILVVSVVGISHNERLKIKYIIETYISKLTQ